MVFWIAIAVVLIYLAGFIGCAVYSFRNSIATLPWEKLFIALIIGFAWPYLAYCKLTGQF